MGSYGQGGSSAWRAVREFVFERDKRRCQLGYDGCLGVATIVDHIKNLARFRIRRDDPRALDPKNLQAVCEPCHDKKTERERVEGLARANAARAAARRKRLRLPEEPHPGD